MIFPFVDCTVQRITDLSFRNCLLINRYLIYVLHIIYCSLCAQVRF